LKWRRLYGHRTSKVLYHELLLSSLIRDFSAGDLVNKTTWNHQANRIVGVFIQHRFDVSIRLFSQIPQLESSSSSSSAKQSLSSFSLPQKVLPDCFWFSLLCFPQIYFFLQSTIIIKSAGHSNRAV
jgi:hypothetical protein